ncbi:uncharacterized protein LOC110694021 isoform X1 [Chenopodium quinoa]|uniref:uncharacterized protein LOC110694021 isoform X1 n=1 Tax=Chenopodium quinoa TaxID=63459 RepID=UPI000B7808C6|nr:uncharacterized protein LOC110694021 isoform X1 [Chenopodium quinoa]
MADQHHQPHHQQQSHSSIRNRCYSFTQHQQQQQHHHHHSMSLPISQPQPQQQQSVSDRSSVELRAVDCNLASLCDHIQLEGFNNGVFSDIVVNAMDSTYHLHRLILSRSSYFRNMLHGPWKEASAPVLSLQIDDPNVNAEAIAISLAYLYGHHPKLNDNNAFRVLAAASFLDLQELCAICTDFIIAELWTSNFLAYQVFAEHQDYGIHGERVRNACWGYLCQSGFMELKEVLPNLSSQTLHALLTSNELWVPSEEKRFELALYTLVKKSALNKGESHEKQSTSLETGISNQHDLSQFKGKNIIDACCNRNSEADTVLQVACSEPNSGAEYPNNFEQPSLATNYSDSDRNRPSSSYVRMPVNFAASGQGSEAALVEGPSEESICCHFSSSNWLSGNDSRDCSSSSINSSCNDIVPDEWSRNELAYLWGGRTVGRRQVKSYGKGNCGLRGEEYDTFINIFEEGSVLYCNMSFEALLDMRKQLEELGFPCKAVNDGLWLQMLLSQRVQEIAAETCKNCCLLGMACACKQPFNFSHGTGTTNYYVQASDQNNNSPGNIGDLYVAGPANGEGNGLFRPVRVNVRGSNDGLAGIGRGATLVPASTWCPTRFVFSRVPFGVGNRNGQQSLANDDLELRPDQHGDMSGDGLTALVGLSDGGRNINNQGWQTESAFDIALRNSFIETSAAGPSGSGTQMGESSDQNIDGQCENTSNASISLDMKTPLSHFPPFRFGVEFADVHRLNDGQVKHSPEAFYAGSFWKISVQAFNDEDPQGRRTLGLFIHRRKAEIMDPQRKVHMYVDSREKVTARYQLICPSKREVMVFGSFKQAGTLLPKAPKGWGWRSAILFDELLDLLQNGCFRVSAVVQLV